MATLEVTPEVLIWARETAALTVGEAANRLGIREARLIAWESGQEPPPVSLVRDMARVYQRPLATFFLSEPPEGAPPPPDFRLRTVGSRPPASERDLRSTLREVKAWQRQATRLWQEDPDLFPPDSIPSRALKNR